MMNRDKNTQKRTCAFQILRLPLMAMLCLSLLVFSGVQNISFAAMKGDLSPLAKASKRGGHIAPLKVKLGKAKLITVPRGVLDILVADSQVIDVSAVQANKLYVVGLKVGDTNLIALDGQGNTVRQFDIHVEYLSLIHI